MEDNGNPHKDRDKCVCGVCMCVHVTMSFRKSVYYRLALKSNVVKSPLMCLDVSFICLEGLKMIFFPVR